MLDRHFPLTFCSTLPLSPKVRLLKVKSMLTRINARQVLVALKEDRRVQGQLMVYNVSVTTLVELQPSLLCDQMRRSAGTRMPMPTRVPMLP